MSHRIIVGIDGRSGGRDALAAAEAIAVPDAVVELVCVYPYLAVFGRDAEAVFDVQARTAAEDVLAEAAASAGRPVHTLALRASSVARGLHQRADESDADLIVVGNPHRSLRRRVVTGDTCRALLHSAPCAIAMVPSGIAALSPTAMRVTVGYDGRPESQEALRAARDLARRTDVPLHVVVAVSPPRPFAPGDAFLFDFDAVVEQGVRRAQAVVDELGADVTGDVRVGAPIAVLADAARDSDVLVVGSRGYGAVRRVVLGSVSEAMVARAGCVVVVIPRTVDAVRPSAARAEEAIA